MSARLIGNPAKQEPSCGMARHLLVVFRYELLTKTALRKIYEVLVWSLEVQCAGSVDRVIGDMCFTIISIIIRRIENI